MGAISCATGLFGNAATQQTKSLVPEDRLERAILACEQKDARGIQRFLHRMVNALAKSEIRPGDQMESAILACQRRDAAIVRHLLGGH